jgi:hypothetical protein
MLKNDLLGAVLAGFSPPGQKCLKTTSWELVWLGSRPLARNTQKRRPGSWFGWGPGSSKIKIKHDRNATLRVQARAVSGGPENSKNTRKHDRKYVFECESTIQIKSTYVKHMCFLV